MGIIFATDDPCRGGIDRVRGDRHPHRPGLLSALFRQAWFGKGAVMTRTLVLAAAVLAASAGAAGAQDVAAGEQSFKKCLPCHAIGEDAKNKVGPELNGIDGRKSGTADGYSYSDANKNSGITWSEVVFKEYITDPRAKIPGTKMVFAGIKSENERSNLWSYLDQFKADGSKK